MKSRMGSLGRLAIGNFHVNAAKFVVKTTVVFKNIGCTVYPLSFTVISSISVEVRVDEKDM